MRFPGFELAFTTEQIGLLESAHFISFFYRILVGATSYGNGGTFARFCRLHCKGAIGVLAHMLFIDAYLWALFRVASGLCIAGYYTVVKLGFRPKSKMKTEAA